MGSNNQAQLTEKDFQSEKTLSHAEVAQKMRNEEKITVKTVLSRLLYEMHHGAGEVTQAIKDICGEDGEKFNEMVANIGGAQGELEEAA